VDKHGEKEDEDEVGHDGWEFEMWGREGRTGDGEVVRPGWELGSAIRREGRRWR